MVELLASAWATAVWWAAVIFFIGLLLSVVSLVFAAIAFLISVFLDGWSSRRIDKEQ